MFIFLRIVTYHKGLMVQNVRADECTGLALCCQIVSKNTQQEAPGFTVLGPANLKLLLLDTNKKLLIRHVKDSGRERMKTHKTRQNVYQSKKCKENTYMYAQNTDALTNRQENCLPASYPKQRCQSSESKDNKHLKVMPFPLLPVETREHCGYQCNVSGHFRYFKTDRQRDRQTCRHNSDHIPCLSSE